MKFQSHNGWTMYKYFILTNSILLEPFARQQCSIPMSNWKYKFRISKIKQSYYNQNMLQIFVRLGLPLSDKYHDLTSKRLIISIKLSIFTSRGASFALSNRNVYNFRYYVFELKLYRATFTFYS